MPSKRNRRIMGLQRKANQKRRMMRLHTFAGIHRDYVRGELTQRYFYRVAKAKGKAAVDVVVKKLKSQNITRKDRMFWKHKV